MHMCVCVEGAGGELTDAGDTLEVNLIDSHMLDEPNA